MELPLVALLLGKSPGAGIEPFEDGIARSLRSLRELRLPEFAPLAVDLLLITFVLRKKVQARESNRRETFLLDRFTPCAGCDSRGSIRLRWTFGSSRPFLARKSRRGNRTVRRRSCSFALLTARAATSRVRFPCGGPSTPRIHSSSEGPGAGIEPASWAPQAQRIPLPQPGHAFFACPVVQIYVSNSPDRRRRLRGNPFEDPPRATRYETRRLRRSETTCW